MSDRLGNLVISAHRLLKLSQPTSRDYKSVLNYLEADHGQLFEGEMRYIYEREDLITVRPAREHAWLDNIVERCLLQLRWCWPIRVGF